MIIQLEIPKEFAKDYANNRFDDFFRRVYADIDNRRNVRQLRRRNSSDDGARIQRIEVPGL